MTINKNYKKPSLPAGITKRREEPIEERKGLEQFKYLARDPERNQSELEKMRLEASLRLREQIRSLVESDDYLIMSESRVKWRDGGDYSLRVYDSEVVDSETELVNDGYTELTKVRHGQVTRRVGSDGFGEAYGDVLWVDGLEMEGNYEDVADVSSNVL